jgi:hypothetical protein
LCYLKVAADGWYAVARMRQSGAKSQQRPGVSGLLLDECVEFQFGAMAQTPRRLVNAGAAVLFA